MSNSVATPDTNHAIEDARVRWLAASDEASAFGAELFQPGSGYGCPDAEMQDRHRLETLRREADRMFREYDDLDRRNTQAQMFQLQRSQQLATWASFCVAAAVGVTTIVQVIVSVIR